MAKIAIKNNFGIIPNDLLNNENVSFRAKGVYAYIQSKPNGWEFSAERISNQTKEGLTAVRGAIIELEKVGYLTRTMSRNSKGHVEYSYQLHEIPTSENPTLENPTLENPTLENLMLYSNKDNSKKEESKKEIINDRFEDFWNLYGKKVGKEKAKAKWSKLKEIDKDNILKALPNYLIARPDPTYRKDPERYITHRVWEDELALPDSAKEIKAVETKQFELETPKGW